MTLLTIALFQANPKVRSIDGVLSELEVATNDAAQSGAEVLVTPELFLSGYGCDISVKANAQMQGSPILKEVSKIAKASGVGIVFGYPEIFENNISLLNDFPHLFIALPKAIYKGRKCSLDG